MNLPGFLLVEVGGRGIGLPLHQVLEVIPVEGVQPVPAVEPALRGVIPARGRLIPLYHLGALLNDEAYPEEMSGTGVLASIRGCALCVEVERVVDVVRGELLPMPEGEVLPWTIGVSRYGDALIPVLDLNALGERMLRAETKG